MALFSDAITKAPSVGFIRTLPRCDSCGLYKNCQSPKMKVDGDGKKKMLIIGEAPGLIEDKKGRPFVGTSGKYLSQVLRKNGIDMRRDCWLTNAIVCRPKGNAAPMESQIADCRPNIIKAINELKPKVILIVGGSGVESVVGHLRKNETVGSISRWAGMVIPNREPDMWICPTFHPEYVLRSESPKLPNVVAKIFDQHVRKACKLAKKGETPWNGNPPQEEREIDIILSPKEAAKAIRVGMSFGGVSAFDYETNMLKPDHPDSEIVSCSICFRGKTTIAYPWHGEAIDATAEYLRSRMPKIGQNIKFEDRWTRRKLGFPVKNMVWDCMQATHVKDHRPKISSIKFQAYVTLGLLDYSSHISPYLEAPGSYDKNRIRELDINDLLLYNGMDSLIEYRIGMMQSREIGIEL